MRQTYNTPYTEVADYIKDKKGKTLDECYQCGTCSGVCPWGRRDSSFNIRKMIHMGQLGIEGFESDLWTCVTCNECVKRCPQKIEIIDIVIGMRAMSAEASAFPSGVKNALGSIASNNNPWGFDNKDRAKWGEELNVPVFEKQMEYLYFSCCSPAFDKRNQNLANAMAKLLKAAGNSFGILGEKEVCCGESIKKTGSISVFEDLAKKNILAFKEAGVKKIITSSAHCYHTFKNEYPEFGGNFEVIHYTKWLAEAIKQGKIKFTKPYPKIVSYHDPCYLGKHNDLYDDPREILKSIPELQLKELKHSKQNSICCGGGGAGVWAEVASGNRLSELRVKDAVDQNADVLATSCPYCVTMLEDGRLSINLTQVEIKDISEICAECI